MWHADANLELRLGVHTFGLLQVRGVGPLDGANHARIKIKPEVGWCAHFTGWTRPCGHETGLDAPAVAEWPGGQIPSNPCNGSWDSMPTA